jgi:hypothetical protein
MGKLYQRTEREQIMRIEDDRTDERGADVIYPTYAEAGAWIDEAEAEPCYLQHSEAAPPTYRIVAGR